MKQELAGRRDGDESGAHDSGALPGQKMIEAQDATASDVDPQPISCTFVVRFWHDRSPTDRTWRGRVDHVQSGQSASFRRLGDMLAFIDRFMAIRSTKRQERAEE